MKAHPAHRYALWLGLVTAIALGGCASGGGSSSVSPDSEKGKVVYLNPGVTATAPGSVGWHNTRVSRSKDLSRVRWRNTTTVQQKIQFRRADWIFVEPYDSSITVESKRQTDWFTIRSNAPDSSAYRYGVVPLLRFGQRIGEPSVTSDP